MFYDNYIRLCEKVGKSPSAVAIENGITKSNVTYWKKGRNMPSDVTLAKLAAYFGCTVSDLKEDVEQKEKPAPESGNELEILDKIIDNMSREELLDFISKATDMLRNK